MRYTTQTSDARWGKHDSPRSFSRASGNAGAVQQAKIAATDRLIDLIVYRLYGLTEEEIAIVEGHANADTSAMGVEQQPALP